jgi:hypothetical protein
MAAVAAADIRTRLRLASMRASDTRCVHLSSGRALMKDVVVEG